MTREALIIAHGWPSAPDRAEDDMARLAGQVARALPDWRVGSATLAAPGSLEAALDGLANPLIFPFFIAYGWFTRVELPRRLTLAHKPDLHRLPAFGTLPEARDLALAQVRTALAERGLAPAETSLLIAAHGSGRSPHPAAVALEYRKLIEESLPLKAVRVGFIEQHPEIDLVAEDMPAQSLCLPLFVAHWGHVESDVPAALERAGFTGEMLPALGQAQGTAQVIAATIARGA